MTIIKRNRLEWTVPERQWQMMSNHNQLDFLMSKGFDLSKIKVVRTSDIQGTGEDLIKFIQEVEDYIELEYGAIPKGTEIIISGPDVPFAEQEPEKPKEKGLQFYPTYEPK